MNYTYTNITTVINELGIHCRPSALIYTKIKEFNDITFTIQVFNTMEDYLNKNPLNQPLTIENIMDLLAMGIVQNNVVVITASSNNQELSTSACNTITNLFSTNFDFKR